MMPRPHLLHRRPQFRFCILRRRRNSCQNIDTKEEKREQRRLRRIRNQRMALAGLLGSVVILAAVIVGGIFFVNKQAEVKMQQEFEEQLAVIEMEEEITEENVVEDVLAEEVIEEEVTDEETETPEKYDDAKVLDEVVEAIISEMTLEEKVAGLFVVAPEGITGVDTAVQAGDGTKTALEKYPVGGLIYFKKNIQSEEQIKKMIENSVSYCKYPMFIAVDEEGGKVARLADALKLENVGPMADIGSGGDTNKSYEAMKTVGTYLTSYGFNLDFAPVADVLTNKDNTSIGDRSFGSDPSVVAGMVTAAMNGLEETGVTACHLQLR